MLIKANVIRAPGRLQAMKVLCAQALRLTHRCPASESAAAVAALQRVSMATQTGFSTSNRGATASGNSNVVGTHVSPSGVREKMTREQASAQEAESLDEVNLKLCCCGSNSYLVTATRAIIGIAVGNVTYSHGAP